jgi:SAM-dependent methyltransferase
MHASRAELRRRFDLTPGDQVLDVGCGTLPFALATHLCDLTRSDDSQRLLGPMPPLDRPFVECDVQALPFADKAFDFVVCAHVLEHVADPAAACRELERVARRGYVECPASWLERVFHSPDHRWLVDHEQGRLIFREILPEEEQDILGLQLEILHLLEDEGFREYWQSPAVRRARLVELYWEGHLGVTVMRREERRSAGSLRWFHRPPRERGDSGAAQPARPPRAADGLLRALWRHASRYSR